MAFLSRPRILLADDYPGMVTAIERLIAGDCDVVGTVSDGAILNDAAERLRPDVILLDLNLPRIDSIDACRHIRRTLPKTRIVVLTGDPEPEFEQAVMAAGASAFIGKSALATHLLPAIASAFADDGRTPGLR